MFYIGSVLSITKNEYFGIETRLIVAIKWNEHFPDKDLFSHSVPLIATSLSPISIFPFTDAGESGSS